MYHSLTTWARGSCLLASLTLSAMTFSAGAAELQLIERRQVQKVNGEVVESHPVFRSGDSQRDHLQLPHMTLVTLEPTEADPEKDMITEQITDWRYELEPGEDGETGDRVCLSYEARHDAEITLTGPQTRASVSGGGVPGTAQANADADTATVEALTDASEGHIQLVTP